jgi:tetratricopeptide (TPR) repeat protein
MGARVGAGALFLALALPILVFFQGESIGFRGVKAARGGDHALAAELFAQAGRFLPFHGRFALEEGRSEMAVGRIPAALERFSAADRLMASSPYPPWEFGRAFQAMDRWEASIPFLEKALKRYPTSPRIHYDLARSHLGMGDDVSARRHLAKAAGFAVFDPEVAALAKRTLRELSQ